MGEKRYLICVDSDGCAMDTMNSKHIRCFGPYMVREWGLENWETSILKRWNEVNLYTETRGINRFQGLYRALKEVAEEYTPVDGLEELGAWVENTPELSNASLEREIGRTGSFILEKALRWSKAVNEGVKALEGAERKPFSGVKEALAYARGFADLAVVSSADRQSVLDEWEEHGLMGYMDAVMAQDAGSKAHCIQELAKEGYDRDKILMVGDALGDLKAAQENGVLFYPILAQREAQSWEGFRKEAGPRFKDGDYKGQYQKEKVEAFLENLR